MTNVKVKTTAEMRNAFVDEKEFADKYVVGSYNFLSELYDMKVAPKFKLEQFFANLNKLTLREEFIIRYHYGIDRVKHSIEEIATRMNISTGMVKAILTRGKKKFMELTVNA